MIENLEQVESFRRFNYKGRRFYHKSNNLSVSVTSIIDAAMPTDYSTKKLISEMGMDSFLRFLNERAIYGTAVHYLINQYIDSGLTAATRHISMREINEYMSFVVKENGLKVSAVGWGMDAYRDVMSFVAFLRENNVTVIAQELVVQHTIDGFSYAGAVDLLCEMDMSIKGYFGEVYKTGDRKGEPKESTKDIRVHAIVDYKTGKNGFSKRHELQLHMYRLPLLQQYPDLRCFNLSPKDWTGLNATYTLKDQTDSEMAAAVKPVIELYKCLTASEKLEVDIMPQEINGEGGLSVERMPLLEYLNEKWGAA